MAEPVKVQITGDASGLFAALQGAGKEISTFGKHADGVAGGLSDKMNKLGGTVSGVGSSFTKLGPAIAIVAALGGAVFGAFELVKRSVIHAQALGDEMDRAPQKVGVSVEALSALKYAAYMADVEFEALLKGLGKLSVAIVDAAENTKGKMAKNFDALGISVKDANGELKDTDVVLGEIAERFKETDDDAKKTQLAIKLFGKSGNELIPMLNKGKDGLEALKLEARELGVVLTAEDAKAADEFEKNLKKMHAAGEGMQLQIGNALIPTLNDLAKDVLPAVTEGARLAALAFLNILVTAQTVVSAVKTMGSQMSTKRPRKWSDWIPGSTLFEWGDSGSGDQAWIDVEKAMKAGQDRIDALADKLWGKPSDTKAGTGKKKKRLGLADEPDDTKAKEKENVFQAELNRLLQAGLSVSEKISVNQAERNALAKLELTLRGEILKIDKMKLTDEEKSALKDQAEINYQNGRITIAKEFAEKRAKAETEAYVAALDTPGVIQKVTAQDTTVWGGVVAGLKQYLEESANHFQQWKQTVLQVMDGAANSFSGFFQSIFQKGMTGAQKWDALWKGLAGTVLKALTDMAAKWLVAAIAQKIYSKVTQQTVAGQAAASQMAAAAGIFLAHAYIPFAGPAIAAGLVAFMNATLLANAGAAAGMGGAATALAVGGRISSPTLALMGEAGPEIVAPERDFKDWAAGFASFGANLARRQDQAHGYDAQGAGFASQASRQGGPIGGHSFDLRGAWFIGSDAETKRMFAEMVRNAQDRWNGANG